MPLPDYSPRSDSFGNWYFGGFQMDSQVETGYGAGTQLTATQADWNTFLDAALGSTNWAASSTKYFFRFPVAYEPQTGQVTTTNYRFDWISSSTGDPVRINTTLQGGTTLMSSGRTNLDFTSALLGSTRCAYAVANSQGMIVSSMVKANTGELNTTTSNQIFYIGWVDNPVFPTNTSQRIRNAVAGVPIDTSTNTLASPVGEGSTTRQELLVPITRTCQVATPNANITDLAVLDPENNSLCIGTIPNSLIYHGTGLTTGNIYRIPPSDDPAGNTEQNIWLCVKQITGWDGSAAVGNVGYWLMRVWSNNIT